MELDGLLNYKLVFNILRTLKYAGRHYLIHETLSCGIVYDSTFGVPSNFFYDEE